MFQRRRKSQYMLLRSYEVACGQEQATKGYEDVASPAPRPSRGKVGKSGSERWRLLHRVEGRGVDHTMHLDRAQCKIMSKGVTAGDELRALLDDSFSGRFICLRNHDGKVFGSEECRNIFSDTFKPFLVPLCRFRKVGKGFRLSDIRRNCQENVLSIDIITHFSNLEEV